MVKNDSNNKKHLKAVLSNEKIAKPLEQYLHLGLLLQSKILLEAPRLEEGIGLDGFTVVDAKTSQIINGITSMFFTDESMKDGDTNEVASTALALANIYTMRKKYKNSSNPILTIGSINGKKALVFDSKFIKEYKSDYRDVVENIFSLLDTEVLESNDENKMRELDKIWKIQAFYAKYC